MPQFNRNFAKGKMNKDLDERLVPAGQYRDALNVEVSTSEGSDVGALETLLGNIEMTPNSVPAGSFCVGSIVNNEENCIYYLVAGPREDLAAAGEVCNKDYIIKYDVDKGIFTYVFVDAYEATRVVTSVTPGSDEEGFGHFIEFADTHCIKPGMKVRNLTTGEYLKKVLALVSPDDPELIDNGLTLNRSVPLPSVGDKLSFTGVRILEFDSNRLITGINIVDDFLMFTDNFSEPKKINIDRSIRGTGFNDFTMHDPNSNAGNSRNFPTRLVSQRADGSGATSGLEVVIGDEILTVPKHVELEDVTVIKKSPLTPPTLRMSSVSSDRVNSNGDENPIVTSLNNFGGFIENNIPLETGSSITITFASPVDYRIGDDIILTNDMEAPATSFTDFQVRLKVTQIPDGATVDNILQGPFVFEVLSIDPDLPDSEENAPSFFVRLQQDPSLFEFKFPRFGYRYKYVDGEYSPFSPFSEIAFLPGEFEYEPKKGYNLAMANKLRSLTVENYAPSMTNRPKDIVEIDILYKEEGSTSVYTVKSIKPSDGAPLWPTYSDYSSNFSDKRGSIEIKSELIHALVASNQLIRPWDNVPRKALAQEVSANRLIFANYVQNYDLYDNKNKLITPDINLTFDSVSYDDEAESLDIGEPKKSLKSMRTYQVGIVYKDEFGRETPVLADKKGGSVKVEKEFCNDVNYLQASIKNNAPSWAKSFKFFIKETSSEYYNLAMHKWYNAEDGNVWLAFNSSDRNKVDIDTFIELKKGHNSDSAVEERARYKIVAIENEAPEDIRIERQVQGTIDNNGNTVIGTENEGFPFQDRNFITIGGSEFREALGTDETYGYNQVISTASDHSLRIIGPSAERSEYYDILRIEGIEGFDRYKIVIAKKFGPDVNFTSTDDTWAGRISGLSVSIVKNISKNKPEFDGKFFVKVYKDLTLQENVLVTSDDDYVVDQSFCLRYINSLVGSSGNVPGGADQSAPASTPYNPDYTWGDNGFPNNTESDYADLSTEEQRKIRDGEDDQGINYWHYGNDGGHPYVFIDQAWAHHLFMTKDGPGDDADNSANLQASEHSEFNKSWGNFTSAGIRVGGSEGNRMGWSGNTISSPGTDYVERGSPNRNDYAWDATPKGVYTTNGEGRLDISVTGIRPGKWEPQQDCVAPIGPDGPNPPGWDWDYANAAAFLGRASEEQTSFAQEVKAFLVRMTTLGTKFRFRQDPNKEVYEIKAYREHRGIINAAVKRKHRLLANMKRNKFTFALDKSIEDVWDPRSIMAHDGSNPCALQVEFLSPYLTEDGYYSENPAIFETYPKENIELDIYYELGRAYPITLDRDNDETLALIGSKILSSSNNADNVGGNIINFNSNSSPVNGIFMTVNQPCDVAANSVLTIEDGWGGKVQVIVTANVVNSNNIPIDINIHNSTAVFTLPWFNCYSFGNGVESDRIRDDFNQPTIQNGVKASTTIAEQYKEERRGNGFIYSGIYNSTSGVNRLNQFIQGEKITKDINPDNGTIQKLFTRNTDIVTLCEDKVVKVLSNKDALFNADGNSNVTATAKVLGAVTPFAGDYGISKNPESFASDQYRCYFTDKQRGAVLRLSKDGLTPISDVGMKDYFSDLMADPRLASGSVMLGTFDKRKDEYNITFKSGKNRVGKITPLTVSFNEGAKGWVSFKSFIPESGVSINNNYYTFKDGSMWKHHMNPIRNDFYGAGVGENEYSYVELIFNEMPSSVKNFQTINYEGSQARINQFNTVIVDGIQYTDKEYYNLAGKSGWYVEYAFTDLAEGKVPEFINKEGKWFNRIFGECTSLENLDTNEFQVQGIGIGSISHEDPAPAPLLDPILPQTITITIKESGNDVDGTNWD
jgi:hypothetical protein